MPLTRHAGNGAARFTVFSARRRHGKQHACALQGVAFSLFYRAEPVPKIQYRSFLI
jgi:hypothetical protein